MEDLQQEGRFGVRTSREEEERRFVTWGGNAAGVRALGLDEVLG